MDPGRLRHRCTILAARKQPNELGEQVTRWVEESKRACRVTPTSVREQARNDRVEARPSYTIVMRLTDLLTPDKRLAFVVRGRRVEASILTLAPDDEARELTVLAAEAAE